MLTVVKYNENPNAVPISMKNLNSPSPKTKTKTNTKNVDIKKNKISSMNTKILLLSKQILIALKTSNIAHIRQPNKQA